MIGEQYINEAIRIRKTYFENLNHILNQENNINDKKKIILKIQEDMGFVVKSDLNGIKKTLELNNKLVFLEKEITNIYNIIKPYHDNIEGLKNDTDRLFLAIKEKYPNLTNEQIEQEIMSKVDF